MFTRWLTLLFLMIGRPTAAPADPAGDLLTLAAAAEERHESRSALELYYAALRVRPDDAFILQKIARQYSDLVEEQPGVPEKKQHARKALDYALRAVAREPGNPVNVLSLAVCHGKLAVYSDTRTKVQYSRLIREEAERALALDPDYAWAHHVLGRWHYEVAALGRTARFLVRLFYGGLPDASAAEAVRHLQRAVELEPRVVAHQLELGFAYRAAGDTHAARRQFERGLAMPAREKHDATALARARAALAEL